MEFGRLESVDGVDFRLPPDLAENAARLDAGRRGHDADLRIGMASWSDPGLVARLGGGGTPAGVLRAHAAAVPANELNSTFYGFEGERMRRWGSGVPAGFHFCPKLPRAITHDRGLDADDVMEAFVRAVEEFGDRRGPLWFALPPTFGPDRFRALERFLRTWSDGIPLAAEVRDERWFRAGPWGEVTSLLDELGVTLILTDTAGRRDAAHMRLTTSTAFVRFVANALHPSDYARLDDWAERLAAWADAGLERAYFFLHQRDEAQTVDLADHLEARLAERGHAVLGPWRERTEYAPPGRQLGLF
ncbi:MAG: DUF72 domain-containing protein [Planctomycetota bacterium]